VAREKVSRARRFLRLGRPRTPALPRRRDGLRGALGYDRVERGPAEVARSGLALAMNLEQQLKRWRQAQLVSPEQAERILAFERQRERPTLLYAVAGLAGLAVAIGLVSIVAANWDLIPGRMKLALDALVVIGLGQALVQLGTRPSAWLEEAARVAYYGLVLASLALVGQVYQLGADAAQALLAWSLLTAPLMALGRSGRVGFLWLVGLQVTYFVGLTELGEGSRSRADHALAAVYWAPLAALALGRTRWLRRLRPEYADVLRGVAWTELVLLASAASLAFYESLAQGERTPWAVVGLSLVATAWLCYQIEPTPAGRAQRSLLAMAFACCHLPLFMPHGKWPLAAALAFIALFAVVALAAHRSGRSRILHLATAAIGLRLLVIYFEVFGTLLDTGVGLVLGGLLTLLVTWFWARKRRDFDRELSARELSPPSLSGRELPAREPVP
jgi:uncharacterized membrane protein